METHDRKSGVTEDTVIPNLFQYNGLKKRLQFLGNFYIYWLNWCLIFIAFSIYNTSSAILVHKSAIRSKLRAIRST